MRKITPEIKKQIKELRISHISDSLNNLKDKELTIGVLNKKIDKLITLVLMILEE